MESFVVKHYNEQAHPSIKGNGFDGLVIGEYREEAEAFIKFVNELIAAQSIGGKAAQANNTASPKLPPFENVEKRINDLFIPCSKEAKGAIINGARICYEYIWRSLRA